MQVTDSAKLRGFVHNAKRFILDYRADIEQFPLRIYSNALQCAHAGSMKEIHTLELSTWGYLFSNEVWGALTAKLKCHSTAFTDIAFSPDGKLLATATTGETINIWDLATRKTLRVLKHNRMIKAIAFLPDGNLLTCAVYNLCHDWTLKLWEPATGKELQTQSQREKIDFVDSIAFSPDGKLLASSHLNKMVHVWDLAAGCSMRIFLHDSEALSIAFSPDRKLLAVARVDGVVTLWDPQTGWKMGTLVAHDGCISAIAFSSDDQLLASASNSDNTVKIWDPATGTKRQTFVGHHNSSITSVAFSPDGKLLASASSDGTVKLWDPTTERLQGMIVGRGQLCSPVTFSPDGSFLAWATNISSKDHGYTGHVEVDLWELHRQK